MCLFAIPPELGEDARPVLFARNAIGDEATAAERFERINSVMRRANDSVLAELTKKNEGKRVWFLWQRLRSPMS